jgi:hypothetical protein
MFCFAAFSVCLPFLSCSIFCILTCAFFLLCCIFPIAQHAIDIDASFVDAFTARGAALVLLERFDDAIDSLEHALRLSADDANAARYLDIARQKKRAAADETATATAGTAATSASAAASAASGALRVAQAVALAESLNKDKLAGMMAVLLVSHSRFHFVFTFFLIFASLSHLLMKCSIAQG